MAKAVLDTTLLVSALLTLNPGGVSYELLRLAKERTFELLFRMKFLKKLQRRFVILAFASDMPIQTKISSRFVRT